MNIKIFVKSVFLPHNTHEPTHDPSDIVEPVAGPGGHASLAVGASHFCWAVTE